MFSKVLFYCCMLVCAAESARAGLTHLEVVDQDDGITVIKFFYRPSHDEMKTKFPNREMFCNDEASHFHQSVGESLFFETPEPPQEPGWHWATMDQRGRLNFPFRKGYLRPLSKGLAEVRDEESHLWGIVDSSGKAITPPVYRQVNYWSGETLSVRTEAGWGVIDFNGKTIVDCQYGYSGSLQEGYYAVASRNMKFGFVDHTGREVIPPQYEWAGPFSEGLAAVELNGKQGYINYAGEIVLPIEYDYCGNFSDGGAIVINAGKFNVLRRKDLSLVEINGSVLAADERIADQIPGRTRDMEYCFQEGMAIIRVLRGRFDYHGFVDTSGSIVIEPEYSEARGFFCGLARVITYDGKWYYINRSGDKMFQCLYPKSGNFHNGRVWVGEDIWHYDNNQLKDITIQSGYLDTEGKEVTLPIFIGGNEFKEGYVQVELPEGYLFLDTAGLPVTPCLPSICPEQILEPDKIFISILVENQQEEK